MSKKVFVLGGTGFLGYYTTEELLRKGYEVATISLPPMPAEDLFSSDVSVTLGDINDMTDEAILEMLDGCDGFIYAAGADERIIPKSQHPSFSMKQMSYQHSVWLIWQKKLASKILLSLVLILPNLLNGCLSQA
ncbi:NAD-dependent epimerase/dehydratase family protein [Enterococcus termitis]